METGFSEPVNILVWGVNVNIAFGLPSTLFVLVTSSLVPIFTVNLHVSGAAINKQISMEINIWRLDRNIFNHPIKTHKQLHILLCCEFYCFFNAQRLLINPAWWWCILSNLFFMAVFKKCFDCLHILFLCWWTMQVS